MKEAQRVVVRFARRLWLEEGGVTAIEYGLLSALIVVVAIGAFTATGNSLGAMYTTWTNAVLGAI